MDTLVGEAAEAYRFALAGDDPVKLQLLLDAIDLGIKLKLQTVSPLSLREIDEFRLALFYVRRAHGTDGHHRLCMLAKFATLLGFSLEGEMLLKGFEPYG